MGELHTNNGKFDFKDIKELKQEIINKGLNIKISENMEVFEKSVKIGEKTAPNVFVSHPMEGGDGINGSPSSLTFRKYENIAKGGYGIIWIEAVSIAKDGHSNDKQLHIREDNLEDFKKLNNLIKKSAKEVYGEDFEPLTIVQLNHSGRYCKVNGNRTPIIATHKKVLDDKIGIDESYPLVTDEYIDELIESFVKGALLCKEAGFDGVDVKACHGYLLGEILSAYNREGKYGGGFENRIKAIREIVKKIKANEKCKGLIISARLNAYDGINYPDGFGVTENNEFSLDEPKELVRILHQDGVQLFSITMGNPYFIPHINKPYDIGTYTPPEDAIKSCERLISGVSDIQKAYPDIPICGVGYTWFREFAPYVASGSLENGMCKLIGLGREVIAYPDFVKDLLKDKKVDKQKVCITCSKCSEMKAKIGTCGCVIRDAKTYMPIYKKMKEGEKLD